MGRLAFNLADKDAKHPSHINVFLGDYGYWDHFYQAGLHEGNLSGSTQPSHVHRLVGSKNRNYANAVIQDEYNEIHIDKLEGHVNFFYDINDEYGTPEDPANATPTKIYNGLTPESSGVEIFILQVRHLMRTPMYSLVKKGLMYPLRIM